MKSLRWQDHEECFGRVLDAIRQEDPDVPFDLHSALNECTKGDLSGTDLILGVEPCQVAFLEYLFHKAQGPYSPDFHWLTEIIATFLSRSPGLQTLINLNGSDTLANMVLNKRGRLKFLIADQLELLTILEWWTAFGLIPVSPQEVFEAVLNKSTIKDRIRQGDPLLILRLIDVFPENTERINPRNLSREALSEIAGTISRPPSERRYHQIYHSSIHQGRDLLSLIHEEEKRILPMQMKRNRFLAYLVKQWYDNTCQICRILGRETTGPIEVHHIVPLSEEGRDIAENMLVTCREHHQVIHDGKITMRRESGEITVFSSEGIFSIPGYPYRFSQKPTQNH